MARFLILVTVCVVLYAKAVFGSHAEHKLIDHLFSHYDKRVRPAQKPNEPLHLHIENLHLKRITHIDETAGTVDIGMWVGLAWNDSALSWAPSSYEGIKHISVRSTEIWTPDLTIFSGWGVSEMSLRESEEHDVFLMPNGQVMYYPSVKLELPCLNATADGLECNFAIGSWALSADMLDLHLVHKELDITKYVVDPKYTVKDTTLEKITIKVPTLYETWDLAVARIHLNKK